MKAGKIIGIIVMLIGIYTSYLGIEKINNNSAEIEALGMELDISNKDGQQQGFIYLGLGVILILGGAYVIAKK